MSAELNFKALAEHLLGRAGELLPLWLPGGRLQGKEYVCAGLRGGSDSKSLSVNIRTGEWGDFSRSNLKGGDLISLYARIHGIADGEACKQLGDEYGVEVRPSSVLTFVSQPRAAVKETIIGQPPANAGLPVFMHRSWGEPVAWWCYRDLEGAPLFYIARYQPEDGGKKMIVPWSWATEKGLFVQKGYLEPRPMYGLEQLVDKPSWPVLLVEGEKAAEAAKQFAGEGFVVMTWPNGAAAVKKTDWTPLQGRDVVLWPDADQRPELEYHEQPGPAAMATLAGLILGIAKTVKIVDVRPADGFAPADGWDAADALADGWGWERFADWIKPRMRLVQPIQPVEVILPQEPAESEVEPEDAEEAPGQFTAAQYATWEQLGISLTQQGAPICNVDNVLRIMEGMPDLFKDFIWWDEFHMKYFTRDHGVAREWQEIDELRFTAHLQREFGLRRISSLMSRDACMIYANRPGSIRNEPKDWLTSLTWDGTNRLEGFFRHYYGSVGTPYTAYASKNFWISMVARIMRPGSQVDTMVVLEGHQGKFKTRSLRIIGGPWYTDAKESVTTKDFYVTLQGKLIVEISELDSFGKAEVETIKKVITSSTDRFRPPYGRTAQDFPRRCVFVGTTNEDEYLRDVTGGRRFWPVETGEIDIAGLTQDREQLFAEALSRYQAWEKSQRDEDGWWLMPSGTIEIQESRRRSDEWETVIADWANGNENIIPEPTGVDIAVYALKIEVSRLDILAQKRISKAMKALGWKSLAKRINGVVTRVYQRPPVDET